MRTLKIGVFYIVEYNKGEGYLTSHNCIIPAGKIISEIPEGGLRKHIFESFSHACYVRKDFLYYNKGYKESQFKILEIDLKKVAFNDKSKGVISIVD